MLKKLGVLGLVIVMLIGVFTACSKEPAATKENNVATNPEEQTENTDSVDSSKTKISFLLTYAKEKTVLYQCLEEFTKETGIELEINYMPLQESRKQIQVMIAGDALPDVMDVDNTDTATYAEMGILADITEKVENEIEIDKYFKGAIEQCKYEDKYYALPFTFNNLCLYYNKDLFKKAGIENPPENWDEMFEVCEKLATLGITPFGVAGSQTTDTSFQLWPFIWGAGADVTRMDSEETVEVLKFYKTLIDNGWMSKEVVNYNSSDNANQFIAGNTAMIIDGPWRLNAIQSEADFEFGVAKVPAGPAGFATVMGGHHLVIVNNNNVDTSWEFLKYMNRPDVMLKYSEAENYIPARRDVAEESSYFSEEPIKIFVEMAEYARPMPTKNYNKVSDALIEMFQSVILGAREPEEAAKEAARVIDSLIN